MNDCVEDADHAAHNHLCVFHPYDLNFSEQYFLTGLWSDFAKWCDVSLEYMPTARYEGFWLRSLIFRTEADVALFRLAWMLDVPYESAGKSVCYKFEIRFPDALQDYDAPPPPIPESAMVVRHLRQQKRRQWVSPWDHGKQRPPSATKSKLHGNISHSARNISRKNNRRG